jgi:rRNA maturation RNase YbeY
MVEIFYEDTKILDYNPEFFVSWLSEVLLLQGKELGDLAVILCSDDYLLEVNKDHLGHDYYTDIITFDYCERNIVSGDLFISIDRIVENAGSYSVSVDDELCRVVAHGTLHLCGYGDKTEAEKLRMTGLEDEALQLIVSRETIKSH